MPRLRIEPGPVGVVAVHATTRPCLQRYRRTVAKMQSQRKESASIQDDNSNRSSCFTLPPVDLALEFSFTQITITIHLPFFYSTPAARARDHNHCTKCRHSARETSAAVHLGFRHSCFRIIETAKSNCQGLTKWTTVRTLLALCTRLSPYDDKVTCHS